MLDRRTFIKDSALFAGALITGGASIVSATPTALSETPVDTLAHIIRTYSTKLPADLIDEDKAYTHYTTDTAHRSRFYMTQWPSAIYRRYCHSFVEWAYPMDTGVEVWYTHSGAWTEDSQALLKWSKKNVFDVECRKCDSGESGKSCFTPVIKIHPVAHMDDNSYKVANYIIDNWISPYCHLQPLKGTAESRLIALLIKYTIQIATLTAIKIFRHRSWYSNSTYSRFDIEEAMVEKMRGLPGIIPRIEPVVPCSANEYCDMRISSYKG